MRGSVQKVELKAELVGQNPSIKPRWMCEGLIFSFFSFLQWEMVLITTQSKRTSVEVDVNVCKRTLE